MLPPRFYSWLESTQLIDFNDDHGKWAPWYFLPREQFCNIDISYSPVLDRPSVPAVGFMRRQDCDTGAAFELGDGLHEPRVFLLEWWGGKIGPKQITQEFPDGWAFFRDRIVADIEEAVRPPMG